MHWIRNIDFLSKTHTLWVPDMPGFGDSDLPRDGLDGDSLAPYVLNGALEVMEGKSFDLVGFSFGSIVASFIAASSAAPVKRLVLVSASAMGLSKPPNMLKSLRGVTDPAGRAEVLRSNLHSIMLADIEAIDELAIEVQGRIAVRDRVKNRKIARTDALLELSNSWRCPVYGIWAREDWAYVDRFEHLLETVKRLNLRETVVIHKAGHWVQYEQPQAFNSVVCRLLQDGHDGPIGDLGKHPLSQFDHSSAIKA
jgi:pimeloyl-ACP methyl ester carboxylesterase